VRRSQSIPVIAADTSTWVSFFEIAPGQDTELLERAIRDRQTLMIPAVLTELLSDPLLGSADAQTLAAVPVIDLEPGYWQRGGWPTRALIPAEAAPLVVVFDEWVPRASTLFRSDLIQRSGPRAVLHSTLLSYRDNFAAWATPTGAFSVSGCHKCTRD
jgi:hypothetical protein